MLKSCHLLLMKFHTSISRDLTDFNLAYLMDHDFV